jgi:hypothetical protein
MGRHAVTAYPLTAFKKMIKKYTIDLQRAMRSATLIAIVTNTRLVCGCITLIEVLGQDDTSFAHLMNG